jgi:hypothetical protein
VVADSRSSTRACAPVMDFSPFTEKQIAFLDREQSCTTICMDFQLPLSHFSTRSARRRFPPPRNSCFFFSHNLQPQIIIGHLFANSGSMSGLSPPPRLLTTNAQHSRYLGQPPLHIWYPSSAKCYCNTCSSRHIPLTLTLQPLAKLGPAIRRDQDSTVSGPLSCASSFPPAWSSLLSSAYLHLPCGLEAYQ